MFFWPTYFFRPHQIPTDQCELCNAKFGPAIVKMVRQVKLDISAGNESENEVKHAARETMSNIDLITRRLRRLMWEFLNLSIFLLILKFYFTTFLIITLLIYRQNLRGVGFL